MDQQQENILFRPLSIIYVWVGLPVNGCIIVRAIGGSFADRREKLHQIGLVEEKEAGDQAGLKKPGWTKVKRSLGQLSRIGQPDGSESFA